MLKLYYAAYLAFQTITLEPLMYLKQGVNIQGVSIEMQIGLLIANGVYESYGHEMTVTSLLDGTHSNTSLHYSGNAADLRTRDIPPADRATITADIKERCGVNFDVILEDSHIHMEYQPRKPT